mmetsp:Transcript_22249/g.63480  ORF Transcript_22249/g.63480 Transcript_22249/m.63480 type:complete len:230 (+) Transcript_22249:1853-2542(+)
MATGMRQKRTSRSVVSRPSTDTGSLVAMREALLAGEGSTNRPSDANCTACLLIWKASRATSLPVLMAATDTNISPSSLPCRCMHRRCSSEAVMISVLPTGVCSSGLVKIQPTSRRPSISATLSALSSSLFEGDQSWSRSHSSPSLHAIADGCVTASTVMRPVDASTVPYSKAAPLTEVSVPFLAAAKALMPDRNHSAPPDDTLTCLTTLSVCALTCSLLLVACRSCIDI